MGVARPWFIFICIPITVFLCVLYTAFLDLTYMEYGLLAVSMYTILTFDIIVDDAFRKNFILLIFNSVQQSGRILIYLFVAIVLIIGPIHDIQHNIVVLLELTNSGISDEEVNRIAEIRLNLFNILENHVDKTLLTSLKPYCKTAAQWNKFVQKGPHENICGNSQSHDSLLRQNPFPYFLESLFNYRTFHAFQRFTVVVMFIYSSYYLVQVSRRFIEDMSYRNYYISDTVKVLDNENLENQTPFEDEDDYASDEERWHVAGDRRMFKTTLPLTNLERRKLYILTDHYRYLNREIFRLLNKFARFSWFIILFVTIYYFDFTITVLVAENGGEDYYFANKEKCVRFGISCVYLIIATLCIMFEPVVKRFHYRLLEAFYPEIAIRRAKILMEIIRQNRKSFIEINRLNIHLRFNKLGNLWTAVRIFVEDTSLADCLGRPSGLFCSICEKEAKLPKYARRCSTYSCIGVYCMDCYEQIRYICLYCNKLYDETMVVHIHAKRAGGNDQQ